MKKDIEWLKKEIHKELEDWHGVEGGIDGDGINEIMLLINQFEESEVKRLERKIKQLESFNDFLIRSNNQLRNELYNQEVLSEEWIDEHSNGPSRSQYVWVDDLKELLVSKQEITEEQVMHWLDNNEFYDHATAETVLANAVDKGELGYYGTKYSVVEKPVIPQFVAGWISAHHERFDLYPALRRLEEGSTRDYDAYKWYRANTHTFVNAYLTGEYEAEEQKYIIKIGNLYLAEPLGDMTSDIVRMTREKEVAYQFTDKKSITTHLDKFEGTEAVKAEEL